MYGVGLLCIACKKTRALNMQEDSEVVLAPTKEGLHARSAKIDELYHCS